MSEHKQQPTPPLPEKEWVDFKGSRGQERLDEIHQPMAHGESPSKPPDNPPIGGPVEDD